MMESVATWLQAGEEWGFIVAVLAVGTLLLLVEVTVVPGFSVPGILGTLGLLWALGMTWSHYGAAATAVLLVLELAIAAGVVWLGLFSPFAKRRLVLHADLGRHDVGPVVRVGDTGVAESDLRPSGVARFGGNRVDVLTQGEYIERTTPVRVLRVEGSRIVVEREAK